MDLINGSLIKMNPAVHSREEVIELFAALLMSEGRLSDTQGFLDDVYTREREVSTSTGMGVAIPHARSQCAIVPSLVFFRLSDPIAWNEDNNVRLIFGIAVPADKGDRVHLKVLSRLARRLMDEEFRLRLLMEQTTEGCLEALSFLQEALV